MAAPFGTIDPAEAMRNAVVAAWRMEINYGPDGEENYAMVYDQHGSLVSNLKIHHARQVVSAANRIADLEAKLAQVTPPTTSVVEAVAWQIRQRFRENEQSELWSDWGGWYPADARKPIEGTCLQYEHRALVPAARLAEEMAARQKAEARIVDLEARLSPANPEPKAPEG